MNLGLRQILWNKYNNTSNDDILALCFTAEEAGSTVKMTTSSSAPIVYLETSPTAKEGSWSDFTVGSTTITLANVGDKVYFRAKQDNERFGTINGNNQFFMTGKIAASGNLNTLLKADGSVLDLTGRDYCYLNIFQGCTSLTQAPALPAETLANRCYMNMFDGCTSLTQAPALPATTLAQHCYFKMFQDCSKLTQVPSILPAETLASSCYHFMFYNCKSLTQAPELPATTLAQSCYEYMFAGCKYPFDFSTKSSSEISMLNNNYFIFGQGGQTLQIICSEGTITIVTPYVGGAE